MSDIYKLCGVAVIALCGVLLLREARSPFAEAAVSFFGVCIMARVAVNISELIRFLKELSAGSTAEDYIKLLLKAAGIAYITELTADICRDAGVVSIASYVEIFGKTELLMLSVPLISELCRLSISLLNL